MAKARATNDGCTSYFCRAAAATTLQQTNHPQRQVLISLPALYPSFSVTPDAGGLLRKRTPQFPNPEATIFLPPLPSSQESELKNLLSQLQVEHANEVAEKPHFPSFQHNAEQKRKKSFSKVRFRVGNASLKRLLSGAFAGAVSRTAVAPLETIRTHLMVGSGGQTVVEVFGHIMQTEGWQGLFRGNGINVIRVAPSKAIELFAYDTVKRLLTPRGGEPSRIPLPISSVAGASAGVCSTLCTYPLELLKTRLTIQRGVYNNIFDAFVKICRDEGPQELYRGLTPSLIGVIPYAAINYFSYETLRKLYRKFTKQQQIGNIATLLIGSTAGAIASSSTFPLEVARKQMQVGALGGRQVYRNLFHALASILEQHGLAGLYRGLGPSCLKLVPAAGISFMCYEACKRVFLEEEQINAQ